MENFWDKMLNVLGSDKLTTKGKERLERIQECPQNKMIPRIPQAGVVKDGAVQMHNGLLLSRRSLQKEWALAIHNKGVLEPQHEYVFAQVAQSLGPAPTMLDIGARSGFYSMWLKMLRPGARCVMIDADSSSLKEGQKNFKRNSLISQAMPAYVGAHSGRLVDGLPVKTITELSSTLKADYISILHADIQGYELELLTGGEPLFKDRGVDYVFVSTHADTIHEDCRNYLEQMRYIVLAQTLPSESFCEDGLLLMRRKELVTGIDPIQISA